MNPRAIVCARFARSWTQQDLADYLGVSHDAVQRWEHGKNFATHQNSDRLALWIQRTNREIRLNQLTPPPGYDELLRRTKDAIDA